MLVENSDNVNLLVTCQEVNGVWKPMKQRPSNIGFDLGKLKWGLNHSLHNGVEFNEEFSAKICALPFVSCDCVYDVQLRFISNVELPGHRGSLRSRNRARNSSRISLHGRPLPGLALRRSAIRPSPPILGQPPITRRAKLPR